MKSLPLFYPNIYLGSVNLYLFNCSSHILVFLMQLFLQQRHLLMLGILTMSFFVTTPLPDGEIRMQPLSLLLGPFLFGGLARRCGASW